MTDKGWASISITTSLRYKSMYKIPGKIATVGSLVVCSLSLMTAKADAFSINYLPITGNGPAGELQADVLIKQGADANLAANKAEWTIKLLGDRSVEQGGSLGFRSFGFNFTDRLAGKVSFESLTDGWEVKGNGTGKQRLTGDADMRFDYVYRALRGQPKSSTISFITTFDPDGDASTIDEIFYDDFTQALLSDAKNYSLSGQVAAHIVGFKRTEAPKGSTIAGEVPTPALLPGLIGMGVAAIRKRKGLDSASEKDIA